MIKITFIGAGSTVFVRNVIGDSMRTPALRDTEIALYDIDAERLKDSEIILSALNRNINENRAHISCYLGEENRKAALKDATFVINAIQVGGYDPCTITDFEIPKKYGLRQTIADTLGIGGIMRALRTIPVMEAFAHEMEEVCPNAWLLNYTNPMAMLTGYMLRYTNVKTVGLCHSVQICSKTLFEELDMQDKLEGRREVIAGINHIAWLLSIADKDGVDLYPEIKKRAAAKNAAGMTPCRIGDLPPVLAAMNMTNINPQLLAIEAARTKKRDAIYHAAMLDPHTSAELSIDDIRALCDELIEAHGKYMAMYK